MHTFRSDRILEWLHSTPQPVLIEVVSDDVPDCDLLDPELREVAAAFEQMVGTRRLGLGELDWLAGEWNIQRVPSLLLLVQGEVVWKHEGLLRMDQLEAAISQYLPTE